jgi:hypothetical protein
MKAVRKSFGFVMGCGLLVTLGAGSALVGCGGDEGSGSAGFKYPTEFDFYRAVAAAQCSADIVTRCYGSDDASLKENTTSCLDVRDAYAVSNPDKREYHPEDAELCVKAYTDAYKDAVLSPTELDTIAASCLTVLHDGGVDGEDCTQDAECDASAGYRCVLKPEGGTCQKPVPVSRGDRCKEAAEQCEAGYQCTGGSCIALSGEGEACSDTVLCDEGYSCVGKAQPTCEAQKGNGSSCSRDSDCKGGFCLKGKSDTEGTCASSDRFDFTSATCASFRP